MHRSLATPGSVKRDDRTVTGIRGGTWQLRRCTSASGSSSTAAAAEQAEDPLLTAASAYHLGQALNRLSQLDAATDAAHRAADALQRNEQIVTPERQPSPAAYT